MTATVRALHAHPQTWLSPDQVAEMVPGVTVRLLETLRGEGKGPAFYKPTPKVVVYAEADINTWVNSTKNETRESR